MILPQINVQLQHGRQEPARNGQFTMKISQTATFSVENVDDLYTYYEQDEG